MNAGLANLDTLKKQLLASSLGPKEKRFDELILSVGLGVAGRMEKICNRKFMRMTAMTEILPADRANFLLSRFPLEQVSQIELKLTEADGWMVQPSTFYNTIDLANGMVITPDDVDAGPYYAQVRFTYDGGYWWETLEPDDDGYPSAMPETAAALPDDLKLAWIMGCRAVWDSFDKLGEGLMDKPEAQTSIATVKFPPEVKDFLQPFIRYQMT